jgi:hypothetical protein
VTRLGLSNRFVEATYVEQPKDHPIGNRAIVVNPGLTPVWVGEEPVRYIPAFSSTVLRDTRVESGDSVLIFEILAEDNISGIVHEPGWNLFADLLPGFPRDTLLYRGPLEDLGIVELDQGLALGSVSTGVAPFRLSVNLWFAPAGTDCAIHNDHDFIEIHSQLHGYGRMQKFKERDHATLYEDLRMSPGHTPPVPFCRSLPEGGFGYPWHQYRADSDCVWLAVEFHAV